MPSIANHILLSRAWSLFFIFFLCSFLYGQGRTNKTAKELWESILTDKDKIHLAHEYLENFPYGNQSTLAAYIASLDNEKVLSIAEYATIANAMSRYKELAYLAITADSLAFLKIGTNEVLAESYLHSFSNTEESYSGKYIEEARRILGRSSTRKTSYNTFFMDNRSIILVFVLITILLIFFFPKLRSYFDPPTKKTSLARKKETIVEVVNPLPKVIETSKIPQKKPELIKPQPKPNLTATSIQDYTSLAQKYPVYFTEIDKNAWTLTTQIDTKAAYLSYKKHFGKGAFYTAAKQRIRAFKLQEKDKIKKKETEENRSQNNDRAEGEIPLHISTIDAHLQIYRNDSEQKETAKERIELQLSDLMKVRDTTQLQQIVDTYPKAFFSREIEQFLDKYHQCYYTGLPNPYGYFDRFKLQKQAAETSLFECYINKQNTEGEFAIIAPNIVPQLANQEPEALAKACDTTAVQLQKKGIKSLKAGRIKRDKNKWLIINKNILGHE